MRAAFTGLALSSAIAVSSAAQGAKATGRPATAKKPASCAWTSRDPWVKRQAEFFDESRHDWTSDSLRTVLLSATNLAVPLKAPVNMGVDIGGGDSVSAVAASVIADLKKLASVRGSTWPTREVVGPAGTHAVYLLARSDTGLARLALKRMMEAGPMESPAVDVAVLEDRLRLASNRKQLYGTQFVVDAAGRVALAPMEDSAHADLRREDAGLPPFKLGLCLARKR